MKVPKIIQEIADKNGCNKVCFIGKRRGKEAYGMGYIDKSGNPIPTGLPVLYLFDGKTVEIVGGEEALELL